MRIRRRAALTAAAFLILLAEVAHAQMSAGRFRIDAQAVQSKKGTPVYSGYIYNDGGRSAPRGHGRELSSARAVVGYLRHWAMSLQVVGAAMVMNATLKVYKGAPRGVCTTLKDQATPIC